MTRKLYDEGLERGRQEADALIESARAEAERIRHDAHAEAARINREARKEADDMRRNTLTELGLAGRQVTGKLKTALREMVVARALGDSVSQAALDPAFVRELMLAAAANWTAGPLSVTLPEDLRGRLDKAICDGAGSLGEAEIAFSDKVRGGFRLAPKDGRYYIDFTDAAFGSLLGEYLRPKVDEILYNE